MLDTFCCGGEHTSISVRYCDIQWILQESSLVKYLCVIVGFRLLGLSVAGEVVQSAVLHEGSKGEDEADRDKQIHSSDIGYLGQGLPGDGA